MTDRRSSEQLQELVLKIEDHAAEIKRVYDRANELGFDRALRAIIRERRDGRDLTEWLADLPPDWLAKQIARCKAEIKTWPYWMRGELPKREKEMTEPSDEAVEVVEAAIVLHDGDHTREQARAIILAYHAHLRSKGLKVTSIRMTQEMYNSAVARVRGGASYSDIWESMHEAAPEVMG